MRNEAIAVVAAVQAFVAALLAFVFDLRDEALTAGLAVTFGVGELVKRAQVYSRAAFEAAQGYVEDRLNG